MIAERLAECLGMMMIGDGILAAIDPNATPASGETAHRDGGP
jgi:hypothetical protein